LATTLNPVYGDVLANRGTGFAPVHETSEVKAGDTVMTRPNAVAEIRYADGCAHTVKPGSVVSVGSHVICKTSFPNFSGRMGATKYRQDPWLFDCHRYPDHCILGAAALVGAGIGIYYLVKDDDKPSSP